MLLDAKGGDINARAATLDAGPGVLALTAAGDIHIMSGNETQAMVDRSQATQKRTFKRTVTTVAGDAQSSTSIGSHLSGGSIGIFAGGDINVLGSDIEAQKNATLKAEGDVNIVSSVDTASASLDTTRTTKGFILPKLGGSSIDRKLSMEHHAGISSQTERPSNITAGKNLTVTADKQANVYASNLSAGEDLKVTGRGVTVLSGTNDVSREIGTKTSKQSVGTMGNLKRAGKGMNGKESVVDRVSQSTLAPATLGGRNVILDATDGNLTLGAAHIDATEAVVLKAPKGAVNMAVVKTATEASQSRGENDPMYQRTRDTGAHVEDANYTRIDSKTLKVDTPKLNVQVGQRSTIVPSTAQGQAPLNVPQQSVEQALQQLIDSKQPGMGWVEQLRTDHSLDGKINWQGMPARQRQWAEKQGSLTPTGAAVLTVVVSVLTWGWGAELVGMSGASVGGAAANAGLSTLASHAAVSLANNNGDIAATLRELGSRRTIKDIVAAMATAGALQGLNIGLGIEGYTTANVGQTLADGTTVGWSQVLQRNLINAVSGGIVNSAIQGTSIDRESRTGC